MSLPSSPPRTMFAQQALDLAQLFALAFADHVASGKTLYKVEMSTPEGPSTGGGVQGVQHLTLAPKGGGPAIVIGATNRPGQKTELRSYALLRQIQERRGASLALEAEAYAALMGRLSNFFESQGMAVTTADADAPAAPAAEAAPSRVPWGLVVGLSLAVLTLGVGLGLWLGKAR